jgi:hypothetical protein
MEDFVKVHTAEQPAANDGTTTFDVKTILDAQYDMSHPGFNENNVVRANDGFTRFYLVHTEKFGVEPVPSASRIVNLYYALLGGLSAREWGSGAFFSKYLPLQQPFLNWDNRSKKTMAGSHEYLNFLVHNTTWNELRLIANIYYTDSTSHQEQLLTQPDVNTYEVYRFAAGYNQLGLAQFADNRNASYYTLHLQDQVGNVISELREYVLTAEQPHFKNLIFRNSLGGWSSITSFGHSQEKTRVRGTSFERNIIGNYDYSDRIEFEIDKTAAKTAKVYLGYISNEDRASLLDFSLSDNVYEVTDKGYLPVTIKFDVDLEDSFEILSDVSFTIQYASVSQFTPEL